MFRRLTTTFWILIFALGCVVFASGTARAQTSSAQPDLTKLAAEAQGWLSDMVRINTVNPPGNEAVVAKYVSAIFQKEGISNEVIEIAPDAALSSHDCSRARCPTPRMPCCLSHIRTQSA